ncbi:hypothetical protein JXO52_17245 [bacterium]|nr:hypothetical protein [bacterium]
MSDIVNQVVEILERAESFLVPLEWIIEKLEEANKLPSISDEELIDSLRQDPRVKVFEKEDPEEIAGEEFPAAAQSISSLGLSGSPRVMLKSRVPTKSEIVAFLLQKADQTYDALFKAWQIRPEHDEDTEDQLLDALAKAQKLQRELRTIKRQQDAKVINEH